MLFFLLAHPYIQRLARPSLSLRFLHCFHISFAFVESPYRFNYPFVLRPSTYCTLQPDPLLPPSTFRFLIYYSETHHVSFSPAIHKPLISHQNPIFIEPLDSPIHPCNRIVLIEFCTH